MMLVAVCAHATIRENAHDAENAWVSTPFGPQKIGAFGVHAHEPSLIAPSPTTVTLSSAALVAVLVMPSSVSPCASVEASHTATWVASVVRTTRSAPMAPVDTRANVVEPDGPAGPTGPRGPMPTSSVVENVVVASTVVLHSVTSVVVSALAETIVVQLKA